MRRPNSLKYVSISKCNGSERVPALPKYLTPLGALDPLLLGIGHLLGSMCFAVLVSHDNQQPHWHDCLEVQSSPYNNPAQSCWVPAKCHAHTVAPSVVCCLCDTVTRQLVRRRPCGCGAAACVVTALWLCRAPCLTVSVMGWRSLDAALTLNSSGSGQTPPPPSQDASASSQHLVYSWSHSL